MRRLTAADQAERLRRLTAPGVALLAAAMALCCLVSLADINAGWERLAAGDRRPAGWVGAAVVVAVAVAAGLLLSCNRLGPGPPLALGAAAATFGLVLSQDINADTQLVIALLTLATAVGALFMAGLCMVEDLPPASARATFAGWAVPLAAGWAPLAWFALVDRGSGQTRLGVHPPWWAVAVVVAVLLLWAVLTMALDEPARPGPSIVGWENAWAALGILVVGISCLTMLVGFQSDPAPSWVRPVLLLTTAVGLSCLIGCDWLVPQPAARPAYLAVVVALLVGPGCLQVLLLVSRKATGPVSIWVLVLLATAGALGCWWGWHRPGPGAMGGLLVMALAAAGGWVMPANEWAMCAAAGPLAIGVAAACVGGLRLAGSRMGTRYVAIGGLVALLFGLLSAAPLAWSLGAEVTDGTESARAGGRILLGLAFSVAVLAAAGVSVLLSRAREAGGPGPGQPRPNTAPPLTCST